MASTSKRKRDDSDGPPHALTTLPPLRSSASASLDAENDTGEFDMALLEALENSTPAAVDVLDVRGVKKLVLGLERRLRDNLEARMKYMDQPERFLDSEVELHEELTRMHALAAVPELYPELVRLNAIPSIVGLLSHENTDIAMDVVSLLHDLTDADAIGDSIDSATVLVEALMENSTLELLAQNITRFDEKDQDEASCVYNTLGIVENMVEVKPNVVEVVGERTKLLRWLLTRVKVREFDTNKLYASEILAILLQNSTSNQCKIGELNGIDILLQSIAFYKSRDPKSGEEEEMLENVFDCLCSCLMPSENKEKFVKAEGVELMIIIMKQKRSTYSSALKTLDFALTKCSSACERFVDVLGLKILFATFMAKIRLHKKTKGDELQSVEEVDERVISIMSSLFGEISKGSRRDRLLSKFVENEFEKIDRLIELYIKYEQRVKNEEKRLKEQQSFEDFELTEEEIYISKLESGLFTLQLLTFIIGNIYSSGHQGMSQRLDLLLKQQKLSRKNLKDVLQEYHDNIGDIDGVEERDKRKKKISKLISRM